MRKLVSCSSLLDRTQNWTEQMCFFLRLLRTMYVHDHASKTESEASYSDNSDDFCRTNSRSLTLRSVDN